MRKFSKVARQRSLALSCFLLTWLSLKSIYDTASRLHVDDNAARTFVEIDFPQVRSSTLVIWITNEGLSTSLLDAFSKPQPIDQIIVLGCPSVIAQVNVHLLGLPTNTSVHAQVWTPDPREVQTWKLAAESLPKDETFSITMNEATITGPRLLHSSLFLDPPGFESHRLACITPLDRFKNGAVVFLPLTSWPLIQGDGYVLGGVLGSLFHGLENKSRLMAGCSQRPNGPAILPSPPFGSFFHNTFLGKFVVLLAAVSDVRAFSPVLCALHRGGHDIHIFLVEHQAPFNFRDADGTTNANCALHNILRKLDLSRAWANTIFNGADIVITTPDLRHIIPLPGIVSHSTVIVEIPRADLQYSTWLKTLTLKEWRSWKTPRIEISVITNNRSKSLTRLLCSLQFAKFFGDEVNIRINAERNSDAATMRVIDDFSWSHGSIFVHHRVIQGGLVAAVVESWYPHSNDTYGVLLEDDIEVSPLFYAWLKMALLRYRYGEPSEASNRLFGISLYQQKVLELLPSGRKVFNARQLFSGAGLQDSTSPFLSSIPCSWGGLYFPEHWREFHAFLQTRLDNPIINQAGQVEHIVPSVRSNHWRSSWKKFFIELVYLRGYVMLYPNYHDYVSFSTNHLEPGSHVKAVSPGKQEMFKVPLMQLNNAENLLDLPNGELPQLDVLPVVNLHGSMSSLVILEHDGWSRRREIMGCSKSTRLFHVLDLFCSQNDVL